MTSTTPLVKVAKACQFVLDETQTLEAQKDACFAAVIKSCKQGKWQQFDGCKDEISQLTNSIGQSLLIFSISSNEQRLSEELIFREISIFTRDRRGNTAFHCAVLQGNAQLIEMLFKHFALDVRNLQKKTPYDLAKDFGKRDTFLRGIDNIFLCYRRTKQYNKTLELLRSVLHIVEELLGEKHFQMALCLAEMGHCYFSLGNYAQALIMFRQAEELFITTDRAVTTLHSIGLCYYRLREYAKALELFQEELSLLYNNADKAISYYDIARCYRKLGDPDEAKENFTEATLRDGRFETRCAEKLSNMNKYSKQT